MLEGLFWFTFLYGMVRGALYWHASGFWFYLVQTAALGAEVLLIGWNPLVAGPVLIGAGVVEAIGSRQAGLDQPKRWREWQAALKAQPWFDWLLLRAPSLPAEEQGG